MYIYTYVHIYMSCQDTKTTFHSWVNLPIIIFSENYPTIMKSSLKNLINYIKTISTTHTFVCALCLIICIYVSLTLMLKHWKMHRYLAANASHGSCTLRRSSQDNDRPGHWGGTHHQLSALPQSHGFPSVWECLPSRTAMCLHHTRKRQPHSTAGCMENSLA